MFEFIRSHTRIMLFALVLLIIPSFVFFGIQGYTDFNESRSVVATVAGRDVTQAELDNAHRAQVEQLRQQIPNLDSKIFDTPTMKAQTLEGLVSERVVIAAADKAGFITTDDRLLRTYQQDPQFGAFRQPDGSLNKEALQSALAAQGLSVEAFEFRLRQELASRQVMSGITGTAFAPASAASSAFDALYQQREIQVQRFDAKDYSAKVNPSSADIEAYYKSPANAAEFQSVERADIEYALLDLDQLKKNIKVSDDELRSYYTQNEKRYTAPEERRASHILITAAKTAPEAERKQARAKAEALLAEVKKNPGSFADVARKNSQDPGSAERGGDLDFFGRGAMVKPFEDVAYSLKPGQISGVVESDFGYHIIQLQQARGGERRAFETVRAEIEEEVKKAQAQKEFSAAALEFTNTVYEQSDSLRPVADKLKLTLQTAKGVTRVATGGPEGPLASAKLLEALFSNDVLNNKRNTEAVEAGPNQLVSARVVKYSPAALLPLADVSARIRQTLVTRQAAELTRKEGQARLTQIRKEAGVSLGATQAVSRTQTRDFPQPLIDAVLKAPAAPMPAFVGVELGDEGFAVVKVVKVLGRDPSVADPRRVQDQYAQAWGAAETQAYAKVLRERFKVKIVPGADRAASEASTAR